MDSYPDFSYISNNYATLAEDIQRLCRLHCRQVTLVAVTKSGTDEELLALMSVGVLDVGENRPQELKRRGDLLRERGFTPRLHEIGKLQRNKVKMIIDSVSLIHSVDSIELAKEIDRQAGRIGRVVPILIEVNSAAEQSKGGVLPQQAEELLLAIRQLENIRVHGLMTMGPPVADPELIRPYFRATRELFDSLRDKYGFPEGGILSMGMSDSYAVAIEEGATMVRVGSRLFEK